MHSFSSIIGSLKFLCHYSLSSTKKLPSLFSPALTGTPHHRALASSICSHITQSMAPKRPITVCVEGNIGSGKTTLLHQLATDSNFEVFQEPVDKWRDVRGMNLLDLMYQDPCRWAHVFQTYVQLTMLQMHVKPSDAKIKVMERSIHSARYCFVENLYRSGKLSEPEYNVYCEWYKMITSSLSINVDLIVYLSAEPKIVEERIKMRGRAEEAKIPLSYLEELDDLHHQWLKSDNKPAPLLVLDQHLSVQQMAEIVKNRIDLLSQHHPPPASSHTKDAEQIVSGSTATAIN